MHVSYRWFFALDGKAGWVVKRSADSQMDDWGNTHVSFVCALRIRSRRTMPLPKMLAWGSKAILDAAGVRRCRRMMVDAASALRSVTRCRPCSLQ